MEIIEFFMLLMKFHQQMTIMDVGFFTYAIPLVLVLLIWKRYSILRYVVKMVSVTHPHGQVVVKIIVSAQNKNLSEKQYERLYYKLLMLFSLIKFIVVEISFQKENISLDHARGILRAIFDARNSCHVIVSDLAEGDAEGYLVHSIRALGLDNFTI